MTNKELHTQFQCTLSNIGYCNEYDFPRYCSLRENKKQPNMSSKHYMFYYSWNIFYAYAKGMTYNEYLREKNN